MFRRYQRPGKNKNISPRRWQQVRALAMRRVIGFQDFKLKGIKYTR
jgi:hypothetical protein